MAYGADGPGAQATDQATGKPVPDTGDPLTAPFWAAAAEERLVVQKCSDCSTWHHPPVGLCPRCLSDRLEFVPVSGRGTVYSFVIVKDQRLPAFDNLMPYVLASVQLDDAPGVMMLSNIPGTANDQVRHGMAVQVAFEQIAPGVKIPQFRAA